MVSQKYAIVFLDVFSDEEDVKYITVTHHPTLGNYGHIYISNTSVINSGLALTQVSIRPFIALGSNLHSKKKWGVCISFLPNPFLEVYMR